MSSIHRILALAGALAIAAPSFPAFAQSAPTKAQQQEAATRFKKGLELFKDGDYQAALIEFGQPLGQHVGADPGQVGAKLGETTAAKH